MKRHLNRAAAIHCATEIERDHVMKLHLRPPIIVEPHGLDLTEFENLPEKGVFRAKYPMLTNQPFVLFLGRIDRAKGLELLVPAIARMQIKTPLVVVGPDWNNMRAWAETEAARLGVADRVIFTGMLRGGDKIAALVDAAVLALPSYHENFGIVVAESLAAGTPVVVSDQVYLHPQVKSAGVGGVVPMDIDALARELDRWMGDEALRATAAAHARPWAMGHFNWNVIARHWLEHYQRAAAGRQAASVGS
jgi:glycosyltransferase involved in cell wall biosynthesis